LAETLKDRWEVRIYDGTFEGAASLGETVEDFRPHYIGLGIRNIDDMVAQKPSYYVDRTLEEFLPPLRAAPDAPVILGGAGFSLFPEALMNLSNADFGIVGEAEASLPALLDCLEQGGDPLQVPGVVTPGFPAPSRPAKHIPGPGASRVDRWVDFAPYRSSGSYPLQTRRGCTEECVYCTYPDLEGRAHRLRDPGDVASEIEEAAGRLGPGAFEFVDSTFLTPLPHAEAVLEEIQNRKLGVRLRTMGINPRNADEAVLSRMKEAGFTQIHCTPDTASPAMLQSMGKGFQPEDLERTAHAVRAVDLPTMWFFLLGGPGETEQTCRETLDFIDAHVSPEDMVYLSGGLRIYPGTPLHRRALEEGMVEPGDDLLRPLFYVSRELGEEKLTGFIIDACRTRLACVPAWEAEPPPHMVEAALAMRKKGGLDEPMFRTLLRIRRVWLSAKKAGSVGENGRKARDS
jgi:radical SAM superfamily enzyme YgiQ (UPF0313 family)